MELNEQQRQVAEDMEHNILLHAAAGTGKTNTMACRIGTILEQGLAKPEEILCLTFTNKACKEMQQRVEAQLGDGSKGIVIRTFHSFCFDLIKAEARHGQDIRWDFSIVDEEDCREYLQQVLKESEKPNELLLGNLTKLQLFIARLKDVRAENEFFSLDLGEDFAKAKSRMFAKHLNELQDMCYMKGHTNDQLMMELETYGAKVAVDYCNKLSENNGLDFSDLISRTYELLLNPAICARWQQCFKFINVDEVQDTSILEYTIISKLFANSRLLLCGDFFQTIYKWRGSDPEEIFRRFQREYNPISIHFSLNYRSTQNLLEASESWLQEVFPKTVSNIQREHVMAEADQVGEPIIIKAAQDYWMEAAWLYHKIKALGNVSLNRVCILTRSNSYNRKLSDFFCELIKKDTSGHPVSFMLVDEFKFFRRQEIKDVIAFLKLAVNPRDTSSLKRVLKRYAHGIGPVTLSTIDSQSYHDVGLALTDFINPITHKLGDPYQLLINNLNQKNVVVFDVEATGLNTDEDDIIQLAAIRIDAKGKVLSKFNHYLKTKRKVGSSELVHHISDAKLQVEGRDPIYVLNKFCAFAKDAVIVGHNVTFDLTILASQLKRLGLRQLQSIGIYDTLDIYRRFYPGLPNHKLEYLGQRFKVKHLSSHDAFDDIMATAEILIQAVNNKILPTQQRRMSNIARHVKHFTVICRQLQELQVQAKMMSLDQLITHQIIMKMGIADYYKANDIDMDAEVNSSIVSRYSKGFDSSVQGKRTLEEQRNMRVENLRELVRIVRELDDPGLSPSENVSNLLKLATLSNTEMDLMLAKNPKVPILTVHQAKGCEFDYVFLAGCQETDFPSYIAVKSGSLEKMQEEARLFYVAITRAKQQLFISYVASRERHKPVCRFIKALPRTYTVYE